MNIIMPDFVRWADAMVDKQDVAIALEQAFKQGYTLGYREGANKDWVVAWDADYSAEEHD